MITNAVVTAAMTTRGKGRRMFERNVVAYRSGWLVFLTGLIEPIFYLFSLGVGLGTLVDTVRVDGTEVPYAAFVAPAMLAVSAMNGSVAETTFNMFGKLKYARLYDAVLATPMRAVDVALGEIGWALARGAVYSAAFLALMAAMGYVHSWYGVLALPAAVLIGFAFGAVGMALATFMRSWQHFDYVGFAIMMLFLLSATFYPLDVYPAWAQPVVQWTPLTQSVELIRELTTGQLSAATAAHVGYLVVLSVAGSVGATLRIDKLLRP